MRRRKCDVYGYATKGTAKRMEGKSSICFMTKDTGALWGGHS